MFFDAALFLEDMWDLFYHKWHHFLTFHFPVLLIQRNIIDFLCIDLAYNDLANALINLIIFPIDYSEFSK